MSNIPNLFQIFCSIKNNKLGTVDGTQINEAKGGTLIMGLRSDDSNDPALESWIKLLRQSTLHLPFGLNLL